MENEPDEFELLVVPFILVLSAGLEANLNDWLIMDTFSKYGPEQYQVLAEGYTSMSFAKKLRLVVAVLTNNSFQLRDDSPIVHKLDRLIAVRNKITHPLMFFHPEPGVETDGSKSTPNKLFSHPLDTLTMNDCLDFHQAVLDFDRLFVDPHEEGLISENELLREIRSDVERSADVETDDDYDE